MFSGEPGRVIGQSEYGRTPKRNKTPSPRRSSRHWRTRRSGSKNSQAILRSSAGTPTKPLRSTAAAKAIRWMKSCDRAVATVNRPVIDRGLFPSTKTHGQEGADRGYLLSSFIPMTGFVMRLQQISAEIAVEVAPHRVDVVGVILRVIQFDQE